VSDTQRDHSERVPVGAIDRLNGSRPRSITLVIGFLLLLFGGGFLMMVEYVITGASGLTITRLFVEPPVSEGGIAWPGWDEIGAMHRDELTPIDSLAARYWWTKINLIGGVLLGPLLIVGLLGVFIGRTWGPICIYSYLATWLTNKILYLYLLGVAGVPKFSLAVGMTVLGVLVLRCKTWRAWVEGQAP
jgi:hypothetical protein